MTPPPSRPSAATREAVEQAIDSLDAAAIGDVYCDEGGEAFWRAHRSAVIELGGVLATALGERLAVGGSSLYVGAGVVELPALFTETRDLDRRCVVTTLRQAECDLLNGAIGDGERLLYQPIDANAVIERGPFDHLAVIGVLSDPETFPQVSAVTYGRASPLQLDPEGFASERAVIRDSMAAWLAALSPGGLITTTFEEVPWILEAAAAAGREVEAEETMVETALVKDPCGFLRLS